MDSTLGKVLASILGLLALAGVVVAGITAFSHSKTTSAVSDVATLATRIRGDYVNNPAGYATLTNAVAIAAGDVPADMLQGSSIVNAWGSAVTIGPVAGNPKDFSIDLGAVPQAACVQLLSTDGNLMGASVGGKQLALPINAADAASVCAGAASAGVVQVSTQYGQNKLSATPAAVSVQYLVVGGGGGGGVFGGGGAGGLLQGTLSVTPGSTPYAITVGAGGQPVLVGNSAPNVDGNGQPSSFATVVAQGGGAGATSYTGHGGGISSANGGTFVGANGGSGGGSGGNGASGGTVVPGGQALSGQGFPGGSCSGVGGSPSGGGGGAGGPGGNATLSPGAGGPGLQSDITGTPTYYAGGGGGGSYSVGAAAGGLGGGGTGAVDSTGGTGTAGAPNTGGGGGAGGSTAGAGGSGVVILSVPTTDTTVQASGSFTVSTVGSRQVYVFTGNGSITF